MMISTKRCVFCSETEKLTFGGHVHYMDDHHDDEKMIAGICDNCKEMESSTKRDNCKGCYGEWSQSMGSTLDDWHSTTYGTDKSDCLKDVIEKGFKPIAITVMMCEETLVFETDEEANEAFKACKWDGFVYGLTKFEKDHEMYVSEHYPGKEIKNAPKIYWLNL